MASHKNGNFINNEQLEELQEGLSELERSKFRMEFDEMLDNLTLAKAEKIQGHYLVTTLGKMVADEGGFNVFRLPVQSKTETENVLAQDKSELIESLLETNKRFMQSLRGNRKSQRISSSVAVGGLIVLSIQTLFNFLGTTNVKGSIEVNSIDTVQAIEKRAGLTAKKVEILQSKVDSLEQISNLLVKRFDEDSVGN